MKFDTFDKDKARKVYEDAKRKVNQNFDTFDSKKAEEMKNEAMKGF